MDPNSQNPQGESDSVKKLEQDLDALTEKAKSEQIPGAPSISIPEEQPAVIAPVDSAPPVAPPVEPVVPVVAPVTPEVTPPQPTPVTAPPKVPKEGSPLMIVAIVLALVAVLAVVVYVFESKLLTPKSVSTPTPVAVVTPSPTPDPTADWQTYSNPTYGFSFKYPNDWQTQNQPTNNGTGQLVITAPNTSTQSGAYMMDIFIQKTTEASASSYVQNLIAQHPQNSPGGPSFKGQTSTVISNLPAIKLNSVFAYDSSNDQEYVVYNGYVYEFSLPVAEENPNIFNAIVNNQIANQILSTFEFVSATPSTTPTSSPSATSTP